MANNFRLKKTDVLAYQITNELLEEIIFGDNGYPECVSPLSASFNRDRKQIYQWFGELRHRNGIKSKITFGHWIITDDDGISFNALTNEEFIDLYKPL